MSETEMLPLLIGEGKRRLFALGVIERAEEHFGGGFYGVERRQIRCGEREEKEQGEQEKFHCGRYCQSGWILSRVPKWTAFDTIRGIG